LFVCYFDKQISDKKLSHGFMTQFFKWFLENKEWLLSGLAVSVPIAIIGLLLNRSSSIKRSRSKGSRDINFGKSGSNSNNILMSGDLTVIKNIDDSEITRNQRLSELARFRGKIYELAFDWDGLKREILRERQALTPDEILNLAGQNAVLCVSEGEL
jgi:hypothetical protein